MMTAQDLIQLLQKYPADLPIALGQNGPMGPFI